MKLYEEERRLFYVGVTRAKNNLCIFSFRDGATFSRELLGKEDKQVMESKENQPAKKRTQSQINSLQKKPNKRIVTEAEYLDKLEEIQTTGYINHKTYGEGMLRSMNGDTLEIEFQSKTTKCKLKFMMEHGLIV